LQSVYTFFFMGHKIGDRRSFKVISSSVPDREPGGRYLAKNPFGAGRKAATKLFKGTSLMEVRFILRETTTGSNKDAFMYIGKKVKNSPPRMVKKVDPKTGKVVQYPIEYDVKLYELQESMAADLIAKISPANASDADSTSETPAPAPAVLPPPQPVQPTLITPESAPAPAPRRRAAPSASLLDA
jgi:hypothetical protein